MLGKRLNYELKSRMNYLVGVSIAVIILSVIISVINYRDMESEYGELISGVILAFSYMAICGAVFFLLTQTINRFNVTFLGNEGYLVHTFPIKGTTHIIADFIADFIQVIITIVLLAGCYFISRMSNEVTRGELRHNFENAMKNFYISGSDKVDVMIYAILFFLTIVTVVLSVIWVIKLGINFSRNMNSSDNRTVPTAITILFVLVGVVLSILVINYAMKYRYLGIQEKVAHIKDATLTDIAIESTLIVLIGHIIISVVAVLMNTHIINKKLNLQ